MPYLDLAKLRTLDPTSYQSQDPYPHVRARGLLYEDAYRRLVANPPPLELFEQSTGKKRAHGQTPHDRLALEYREELPLPAPWAEFVDELRAGPYAEAMCRLIGVRALALRFHWHWATRGNSVSPHCDAIHKYGSHVFYLNTEEDWKPEWGGETLVLDDGGRFRRNSAPAFEDFDRVIPADAGPNQSLVFTRRGDSWHGVREIRCPEGYWRKVFIVVLEKAGWRGRLARLV